jgi:hypothetical protein
MPEAYFRKLSGKSGDFESAIDRAFKIRSSQLKALVAAFGKYLETSTPQVLMELVAALMDWRESQPAEFANRAGPIWEDLWIQLRAEMDRHPDTFFPGVSEIPDPPKREACLNWVNERLAGEHGLGQFSTYACLDATTFEQCINGVHRAEVLKRQADWKAKNWPAFGTNAAIAMGGIQKEFNLSSLRTNYTRIRDQGGRGAVCTTFAYLGAHVLLADRPSGPRVEIVSFPNGTASHVYLLVGRRGWPLDYIPDNWDAVVVDPWAASLGHPGIYGSRKEFVFNGMTKGLQVIKSRPAV